MQSSFLAQCLHPKTNSVSFCVKVTGHNFEVETETFKLCNIMEAPLLKYKEEIEVSVNCQDEEIMNG